MRHEISGAIITDEIAKTLATLQNEPAMTQLYYETIDEITRTILLNPSDEDDENLVTISRLSVLQHIRRALLTLAEPLDNDEAPDIPQISH